MPPGRVPNAKNEHNCRAEACGQFCGGVGGPGRAAEKRDQDPLAREDGLVGEEGHHPVAAISSGESSCILIVASASRPMWRQHSLMTVSASSARSGKEARKFSTAIRVRRRAKKLVKEPMRAPQRSSAASEALRACAATR